MRNSLTRHRTDEASPRAKQGNPQCQRTMVHQHRTRFRNLTFISIVMPRESMERAVCTTCLKLFSCSMDSGDLNPASRQIGRQSRILLPVAHALERTRSGLGKMWAVSGGKLAMVKPAPIWTRCREVGLQRVGRADSGTHRPNHHAHAHRICTPVIPSGIYDQHPTVQRGGREQYKVDLRNMGIE